MKDKTNEELILTIVSSYCKETKKADKEALKAMQELQKREIIANATAFFDEWNG